MSSNESEKRKHPRVNGHFIVSYSLEEKDDIIELSQTKNLSQGGIALSTSIKFNPETQLVLKLRIPLAQESVRILGRVVESRKLGKNHYDTRIQFVTIDEKYRDSLINTIARQLPPIETEKNQKRKHPRINGHFIVSYSLDEKDDIIELSQTKNLSQGGMALNTSIKFDPGTQLAIKLRIPLAQEPVKIIGRVVESQRLDKNRYDTRIQFVTIDEKYRDSLINTIARQLPPIETEKSQKRQHPRVNGHFIVSYSLEEKDDIIELSQTKNLSQGGIALSTSIKFDPGTQLVLKLRIPLAHEPVKIIGRVVESRELGKNYYNTRIQFITIDEKYRDSLINTITHQLKKQ